MREYEFAYYHTKRIGLDGVLTIVIKTESYETKMNGVKADVILIGPEPRATGQHAPRRLLLPLAASGTGIAQVLN